MRRASVRVALTTCVLLSVLVVAGAGLLYVTGRRSFRRLTDRELDTRAAEVEDYLRTAGPEPVELVPDASVPEQFTQLLDGGGSVVLTSSMATSHDPLVSPADAAGSESAVIYRTRSIDGVAARARLRVSHVRSGDHLFTLVVGANLDEHDRSQRHRLLVFVIAGALAGGVAALLAERVTQRSFAGARQLVRRLDRLPDDAGTIAAEPVPPELRDLTDHLDALADRVAAASAREREFIAGASHDLVGGAVRVMNEVDLLGLSSSSDVPNSALAAPQQAAHEFVDYVAAMVDLSRLHVAPPEDRVAVDLRELSDRLVAELDLADSPNIEVAGQTTAYADPVDVERALRNLLANATRHAVSHVTVTMATTGDLARVEVLDDGPGFPDAVLRAIDQPLPNYGHHRVGNGLGLHIARTALERNDAALTIGNHPTGGAMATIRLPRSQGCASQVRQEHASRAR